MLLQKPKLTVLLSLGLLSFLMFVTLPPAYAASCKPKPGQHGACVTPTPKPKPATPTPTPATPGVDTTTSKYFCGDSPGVQTAINIGCRGKGNPIVDMVFAVIRFLSDCVGIVIIGSIMVGGIQYTTSAGDPQLAAKAVGRIRATIIALGLYIFAYPLLNYLIPAGFFR